jgi:hypothetical protein
MRENPLDLRLSSKANVKKRADNFIFGAPATQYRQTFVWTVFSQ